MLEIVQNNPYRFLGIYSNSPAKERVANHNKLKAFLKVGKEVEFELDLPLFFPKVVRTLETVAKAEAQLTLPDEQLKYAQFWFAKVTPLDDIAMNHLIAGNMDEAISIWEKKDTVSSLQNQIVCALITGRYADALEFAGKLYSSHTIEFANIVLGESHAVDFERLEYCFLDELCSVLGVKEILPYLTNAEWKQYVNAKTIQPLIDSLQTSVDVAKASKGKGYVARYEAGVKLMNGTRTDFSQLKTLLANTDLQFQMIADKLGLEILQCGIDYYNDSEESDSAIKAMKLQKYALSVVVGKMAKERCKENVDILQKAIDSLPPAEVYEEDRAIKEELRKYHQLPDRIVHAVVLLNNTKSYLQSIKAKLGEQNDYYLKISTQIVGKALYNVIEEVNHVQKDDSGLDARLFLYDYDLRRKLLYLKVEKIKSVVREAWKAIILMDSFDMDFTFKIDRYDQNRSTLENMCRQLNISTSVYTSPSSKPVSSSATASSNSGNATKNVNIPSKTSDHTSSTDWGWFVFGCVLIVIVTIIVNGC